MALSATDTIFAALDDPGRALLVRLKTAAEDVFLAKGYDAATTDEIAARAGVAPEALAPFVDDKRELLFLAWSDHFHAMTEKAFTDVPEDAPFLDQLMVVFRHIYVLFRDQAHLARPVLKEALYYRNQNVIADAFRGEQRRLQGGLLAIVKRAQDANRIASEPDAMMILKVVHAVLGRETRDFLNPDEPDLEAGLADVREKMELIIKGIGGD